MAIIDTVRRRAGILQDISLPLKAGDEDVDLGVGGVYALPLVSKNGVTLDLTTHYTWPTYRSYLTLVTPASDGDEMFIQAQRTFSTQAVQDVIDEAQNMVVYPALKLFYEDADIPTSLTVQSLIAAHATGRLRQDMAKGAAMEDPKYRSGSELIREVREILLAIRSGSMGIVAADGTETPNREGAFVGSFISPDGELDSRLKLVDRAQRWLGTIRHFWPEGMYSADLRQLA